MRSDEFIRLGMMIKALSTKGYIRRGIFVVCYTANMDSYIIFLICAESAWRIQKHFLGHNCAGREV